MLTWTQLKVALVSVWILARISTNPAFVMTLRLAFMCASTCVSKYMRVTCYYEKKNHHLVCDHVRELGSAKKNGQSVES